MLLTNGWHYLDAREAVAAVLTLYERERSPNKLVLWRHQDMWRHISYYATLHMDTATCLNNKLTDLINDGVKEVDCYRPRQ